MNLGSLLFDFLVLSKIAQKHLVHFLRDFGVGVGFNAKSFGGKMFHQVLYADVELGCRFFDANGAFGHSLLGLLGVRVLFIQTLSAR